MDALYASAGCPELMLVYLVSGLGLSMAIALVLFNHGWQSPSGEVGHREMAQTVGIPVD